MYINELQPGMKVTIQASDGIKKIDLDTTVAAVTDPEDITKVEGDAERKSKAKYVLLDPIRQEDKLINFVSDYVFSHLIVIVEGNKPMIWRNITIANFRLPHYGSVHLVLTQKEGQSYNRRQSYRLPLDCDGVLRIRTAEKEDVFNVFVKDLSEIGLGFIVKGDKGLKRGSGCIIEFSTGGSEGTLRLDVVVIRVQEMDNDRFLMGCRLRQRSSLVARFINEKQKERMKTGNS